jgi:hypothetical protein
MKKYTALFAINVPHYGFHDIEAGDDQGAIAATEALYKADTVQYDDPEWANAVCARIVHITDPDGRVIAYDKPLDPCFVRSGGDADRLLCDSAADMLKTIDTLIGRAEDLISAIDGTTVAFDTEVGALCEAIIAAHKVALKARGQS